MGVTDLIDGHGCVNGSYRRPWMGVTRNCHFRGMDTSNCRRAKLLFTAKSRCPELTLPVGTIHKRSVESALVSRHFSHLIAVLLCQGDQSCPAATGLRIDPSTRYPNHVDDVGSVSNTNDRVYSRASNDAKCYRALWGRVPDWTVWWKSSRTIPV